MTRSLIAFMAFVSLALVGCASPAPPPQRFPEITFSGAPFKLNVGAIEIVEAYTPPLAPPHVEHLFAIPPERMASRWAKDRLAVAGGPLRARFTVKEAGVIQTDLPATEGLRGAFTKDQRWRYSATLDVQLDIVDERGFAVGSVNAHVERSQTAREDTTVAQRDELWYQMTQDMAKGLDTELDRNIRANLTKFIAY